MRSPVPSPRAIRASTAPCRSARREISRIYLLQIFGNVGAAAFIAGARSLTGDVEVYDQPSFEPDGLQHAMAGGEVDLSVSQVGDAFAIETVRSGSQQAAGVLVVRQHDSVLVLFERLRHVAAGQVEVRRIRREIEQLG